MLSALTLSLVIAQANPVDAVVQKHMGKGLLGVGVAVLKDGKVVHLKTYGKGAMVKNDGHYRLASITKQFTAGLIVRLVRDKKFAYEDNLGKLMPDTPATWHWVTVRQLLTHTSGIPSYTDSPKVMSIIIKPTKPDGIWQFVKNVKMDFEPGKGWKYNNTGYCLLGSIIERTTKMDYFSALNKYILAPTGMHSSGPESKYKPVASYGEDGKPSFPINMDWPYAAGSLVSTLGDMAKWDVALRGGSLFTEAEKQLMFNPDPTAKRFKSNYGFGWDSNYTDGQLASYSHTGGIPGFSNVIERTVKGTTVIVLANHEYKNREALSNEVRELFELTPVAPAIADSLPELTLKHQIMFKNLLDGKADEADFSPAFLKQVPLSVLISTSKQFASLGALSNFVLLTSEGEKDVRRSYRVKLGDTVMTLNIAVSGGVIVGMTIR